jgi:hypothetical protein
MSHYVYGEVQANCDVQTMARVLEMMVPEWKGKIKSSDSGDIKLQSNYEQAKETYHIRVAHGAKGISYEDFGMKRVGDKWIVAMGGHSSVAGKRQKKFESEIPGEIGRLKAKKMINKMSVLSLLEEEDDDEFVFKFKFDGDDVLNGVSL